MCNSYEEPSLSDMEINTTSDSSAEPVFLSDASKVICHGPGLSKGFLGRKNTFYVDCSKVGECSLTLAKNVKGIVHFEIKIWYLSAYPKGIQDVGVFFLQ